MPQIDEPVAEEAVEYDEICVRKSPGLWLWLHKCVQVLAIARKTRMVLGFVLSDRSDASFLRLRDEEVAPAYWGLPSFSDGLEAYAKYLPSDLHEVCSKGSGKTSIVEGLNTKSSNCEHLLRRQRQSGLVRKSCGVCWRILDDIGERFLILVDQHNREMIRRWNKIQASHLSPLESP